MSNQVGLQQFVGEFMILREQKICTSSHKNIRNIWMTDSKASLAEDAKKLVDVPINSLVIIESVYRKEFRSHQPGFIALGYSIIDGTKYEFEYFLGYERGIFRAPPWIGKEDYRMDIDWSNIDTIYFTEDVPLAFPSKRFTPQ